MKERETNWTIEAGPESDKWVFYTHIIAEDDKVKGCVTRLETVSIQANFHYGTKALCHPSLFRTIVATGSSSAADSNNNNNNDNKSNSCQLDTTIKAPVNGEWWGRVSGAMHDLAGSIPSVPTDNEFNSLMHAYPFHLFTSRLFLSLTRNINWKPASTITTLVHPIKQLSTLWICSVVCLDPPSIGSQQGKEQ